MPQQQELFLKSPLGETLYGELVTVPQPRGTVIVVHGMGEHLGRYQHVVARFASLGYQTLAYDHRGHGRSAGKRLHVVDFTEYTQDLQCVVDRAKELGTPLFLLAHSMGALISLMYLSQHAAESIFAAAALIGVPLKPVVEVPAIKTLLTNLLGRSLPTLRFANEVDPADLARNPKVGEVFLQDPLNVHTVTVGWYRAFLKAVDEAPKHLDGIRVPALLLHGGDDRIAHPDGSRVAFQAYPTVAKELHVYEGCFHELLQEDCHAEIVDAIAHWFQKNLRAEERVVAHGGL